MNGCSYTQLADVGHSLKKLFEGSSCHPSVWRCRRGARGPPPTRVPALGRGCVGRPPWPGQQNPGPPPLLPTAAFHPPPPHHPAAPQLQPQAPPKPPLSGPPPLLLPRAACCLPAWGQPRVSTSLPARTAWPAPGRCPATLGQRSRDLGPTIRPCGGPAPALRLHSLRPLAAAP